MVRSLGSKSPPSQFIRIALRLHLLTWIFFSTSHNKETAVWQPAKSQSGRETKDAPGVTKYESRVDTPPTTLNSVVDRICWREMKGSQFLTVPTVPFPGSFIKLFFVCFFEFLGIIKRHLTTSSMIQREFPVSEMEIKHSTGVSTVLPLPDLEHAWERSCAGSSQEGQHWLLMFPSMSSGRLDRHGYATYPIT